MPSDIIELMLALIESSSKYEEGSSGLSQLGNPIVEGTVHRVWDQNGHIRFLHLIGSAKRLI
jgi:hypothetical protein